MSGSREVKEEKEVNNGFVSAIVDEGIRVTKYVNSNFSTVLNLIQWGLNYLKENKEAYTASDMIIIQLAQAFYRQTLKSDVYPIHIRYWTDKDSELNFANYKLEDTDIRLDESRLHNNIITPQLRAIIIELINCYNAYRATAIQGNRKSVCHMILYLIDLSYSLSDQNLSDLDMVEEIDKHITYIEELMTIPGLDKSSWTTIVKADAENCLANIAHTFTKQCRPKIVEIRKRLSAAKLLDFMGDALVNLCHTSFSAAIHIASTAKIASDVSLVNIANEKRLKEGDEAVRAYAIDPMDQDGKNGMSFKRFIYWFSTSLLNRLEIKGQTREFRSYITAEVRSNLLGSGNGFYEPFKEEFLKHFLNFCVNCEKLTHLYRLVNEARTTCDNGGNINYFIIEGEASATLLAQLKKATMAFKASYNEMCTMAKSHRKILQKYKTKTNDDLGWISSFDNFITYDLNAVIKYTEKMGKIWNELDTVHEYFSRDPNLRIKEHLNQTKKFRKNVVSFSKHLDLDSTNIKSELPYIENDEILNPPYDYSENRPLAQLTSEYKRITTELITMDPIPELSWDYYTKEQSASHLNGLSNLLSSHGSSKVQERLMDFIKHEKAFMAKCCEEKAPSDDYKHAFKNFYDKYCELDNALSSFIKGSNINSNMVKFILYFKIELSYRLIKHLQFLIINEKCEISEMDGSIKRFKKKCLDEADKSQDNIRTFGDYAADLFQMASFLSRIKAFDHKNNPSTSATRENKSTKVENDDDLKSSARSDKPSDKNPPFKRFIFENNNGSSNESNNNKSEPSANEGSERPPKPETKAPVLRNGIMKIFNTEILLSLKERDNSLVFTPFQQGLYEALKAAKYYAKNPYNGWNIVTYYDDNVARHKRHMEHYEVVLQCLAYLTGGAVCNFHSGDLEDLYPVTNEDLLKWIESTIQAENQYWRPYPLYTELHKVLAIGLDDAQQKIKKAAAVDITKIQLDKESELKSIAQKHTVTISNMQKEIRRLETTVRQKDILIDNLKMQLDFSKEQPSANSHTSAYNNLFSSLNRRR